MKEAENRFEITKRVGLFGIIGNIFLLSIKAIVGFSTKSQAMIADSINSAGDIFASILKANVGIDNTKLSGYAIYAYFEKDNFTILGKYKTMKKAKEVLAEITEFWKNGAMSDYKGFICYEMPED